MMTEYDVDVCSEECGVLGVDEGAGSRRKWRMLGTISRDGSGGMRVHHGGYADCEGYCPACGTRVGIDELRGPWRERMVPESDADRLTRGLRAMAMRVVEDTSSALSEWTGEPTLTGPDAAGPAADIMREVMAAVDAGPQGDGGLLEVPDAVLVPRAALEWLAERSDYCEQGEECFDMTHPGDAAMFGAACVRCRMDAALNAAEESGDDD